MTILKLVLQIATLLAVLFGCGPDAGEVALFERSVVNDAVKVGAPFQSAKLELDKLGYECTPFKGRYTTESGESKIAPLFLWCDKRKDADSMCRVRAQVVVVPKEEIIAELHFSTGNICL